ncbi:putative ORFan [Tupanvirus deep ocean]|uniref:ORFan n=2 Tax=Tupanvirus TaxID=2094720 RepID=A0AC62A8T9_9VIRU|nr:putative ORFan [Tupanvirus deep ocean]QKU34063.1 putative ORFan [Tupanvirus deep ocean]
MGNWRRIRIQVTIPEKDVENVREFVNKHALWSSDKNSDDDTTIEIIWQDDALFPNYPSTNGYQIPDHDENIITKVPLFEFFISDSGGMCGIGDWVDSDVDVIGNIGKSASNAEIMKEWTFIATKFPEIRGEIHVCGDYESKYCVGRVVVDNGRVSWNAPTIKKINQDDSRIGINLTAFLSRMR